MYIAVHTCYTQVTSCHNESPQCGLGYERLQLGTNEKYPALQCNMLHTRIYVVFFQHIMPPAALWNFICHQRSPLLSIIHYSSTSLPKNSPTSHLLSPNLTLLTPTSTHTHIYTTIFIFPPPLSWYTYIPTHHYEGCYRREPGGNEPGLWVQTTGSAAPESVSPYHWCGLLSGVIR